MSTIFFGLRQKRKQHVAVLRCYMVRPEQLQCVGEVDHLRDRRRLFERVVAEGERYSGHLAMEALIGLRCATGNDLGFALRRRVLDAHIKTSSPDRVTQPAFLIPGEHDKGTALRSHDAELWNRELPS